MENIDALNWEEAPAGAAPARPRASSRAWWVFWLGLASAAYAYALFLYLSNPPLQNWVSAHWPAADLPGVFLVVMAAGLGLSFTACVLGWRELKAIRRGEIPKAGRVITWVGLVLAVASFIFFYIGVIALRFVKNYAIAAMSPFGR